MGGEQGVVGGMESPFLATSGALGIILSRPAAMHQVDSREEIYLSWTTNRHRYEYAEILDLNNLQ